MTTEDWDENGLIDRYPAEKVQDVIDSKRFVADLMAARQDIVSLYKKMTKDELIAWLLEMQIGYLYENARTPPFIKVSTLLLSSHAYQVFVKCIAGEATEDETVAAIEEWRDTSIVKAGNNKPLIVEISMYAGGLMDRVRTHKAVKGSRVQRSNLNKGPQAASTKRTAEKDKKQARLKKAIDDMFDKPEKPGWGMTNEEIRDFLLKNGNQYGYKDSVVLANIKKIAVEWRKKKKSEALDQCDS